MKKYMMILSLMLTCSVFGGEGQAAVSRECRGMHGQYFLSQGSVVTLFPESLDLTVELVENQKVWNANLDREENESFFVGTIGLRFEQFVVWGMYSGPWKLECAIGHQCSGALGTLARGLPKDGEMKNQEEAQVVGCARERVRSFGQINDSSAR